MNVRRMNHSKEQHVYSRFFWSLTNPSTNSSIDYFDIDSYDTKYVIVCSALFFLGFVGVPINGKAIYVFFKNKEVSRDISAFILMFRISYHKMNFTGEHW